MNSSQNTIHLNVRKICTFTNFRATIPASLIYDFKKPITIQIEKSPKSKKTIYNSEFISSQKEKNPNRIREVHFIKGSTNTKLGFWKLPSHPDGERSIHGFCPWFARKRRHLKTLQRTLPLSPSSPNVLLSFLSLLSSGYCIQLTSEFCSLPFLLTQLTTPFSFFWGSFNFGPL